MPKRKKIFLFLILLLSLTFISNKALKFYSSGQVLVLKQLSWRLKEFDFSFFKKFRKSKTIEIENLEINIDSKSWNMILNYRDSIIDKNIVLKRFEKKYPAKIKFKNHLYDAKISLTGQTAEHVEFKNKISFSIILKNNQILGMNKFAVMHPHARGYLTDWIGTKLLIVNGAIGIRTNFINVSINNSNKGLYLIEERFSKELMEHNNLKNTFIMKINEDGSTKLYNKKKTSSLHKKVYKLIDKKVDSLFNGCVLKNNIFDLDKLALVSVVSDVLNQKHALFFDNLRFYYNSDSKLLEPIAREWGYLRVETKTPSKRLISIPSDSVYEINSSQLSYHWQLINHKVLGKIINSESFRSSYLKYVDKICSENYLDTILLNYNQEFTKLLLKTHSFNPFYKFPINLFKENQASIKYP